MIQEAQVSFSFQNVSVCCKLSHFNFYFRSTACPVSKHNTNVLFWFWTDLKFKMAMWLLFPSKKFQNFLKNYCMWSHHTCQKCSSKKSELKKCCYISDLKSKMVTWHNLILNNVIRELWIQKDSKESDINYIAF